MPRDSRVEAQLSTNAVINKRSSSRNNLKVRFWKWIPLSRDSSLRARDFIPRLMKRSRDPVNVGGFKGRTMANYAVRNVTKSTIIKMAHLVPISHGSAKKLPA